MAKPKTYKHIPPALAPMAVAISELHEDESNARTHRASDVGVLAEAIRRFGFRSIVVVQKQGMIIRQGNGRYLAAKMLGMTHIPAMVVNDTDVEATAAALADNRVAELSAWNYPRLAEAMAWLDENSSELAGLVGFGEGERNHLTKVLEASQAGLRAALDSESSHKARDGFFDPLGDAGSPDDENDHTEEPQADEAIEPEDLSAPVSRREDFETIHDPGDVVAIDGGRLVVRCGDCLEYLRSLEPNTVDAIVTDPPYGIGVLDQAWDQDVPGPEFARLCMRVLKPGAFVIAASSNRTVHRLTTTLEDAGFEVKDIIHWAQFSHMPVSQKLAVHLDNRFAKPLPRGGRVSFVGNLTPGNHVAKVMPRYQPKSPQAAQWDGWGTSVKNCIEPFVLVQKPTEGATIDNLLKWGVGGLNIDACRFPPGDPRWLGKGAMSVDEGGLWPANLLYVPRASMAEREAGCEHLPTMDAQLQQGEGNARKIERRNSHPTIKPIALMSYLLDLVTPPGGLVVEPFLGSGSTMVAAVPRSFRVVGIERAPRYVDIAVARTEHALAEFKRKEKSA